MPSSPPPIAELLAGIHQAFGGLGVRWFLFGAQAAAGFELRVTDTAGFIEATRVLPFVVTMKVLAGRPRDIGDVAAILRLRRGHLDLHRIRTTLGLLEDALDRRDLVSELDRLLILAGRTETPPPA